MNNFKYVEQACKNFVNWVSMIIDVPWSTKISLTTLIVAVILSYVTVMAAVLLSPILILYNAYVIRQTEQTANINKLKGKKNEQNEQDEN